MVMFKWEYKLEWQRKWRESNPEKARELYRKSAKRRREQRPEEAREYRRKEYLKNAEYYREKSRLWRLNNRERFLEQQKMVNKKRKEYTESFKNKSRCMGCECLLKENEKMVCSWCIFTYPHKYAKI